MTQSYERAAPPDDGPADPNRWRALTVCLVAGFMTLLDVSIVNVEPPAVEGRAARLTRGRLPGAAPATP